MEDNTLAGNQINLYFDGDSVNNRVTSNDIRCASGSATCAYSAYTNIASGKDVNAENNLWEAGTVDGSGIEALVFHCVDDASKGCIDYDPWSGQTATTDIAVTAVNAPASVIQGDVVNVDVTVENVGNQDVGNDISVTLTDETDGATIGSQTISGGLAAGASVSLGFSWDTGSVSLGDHTLIASHDFTDDDSTNDSESTTASVGETASETIMHVGDLDGASTNQGSTWQATVTILVHDAGENPVSGASVSGAWDGTTGTTACTTGTSGQCTVTSDSIPKRTGSVSFSVTSVTGSLTYDESLNHDPDSDSDGTSITLSKP